jgi:hypothetical protein
MLRLFMKSGDGNVAERRSAVEVADRGEREAVVTVGELHIDVSRRTIVEEEMID